MTKHSNDNYDNDEGCGGGVDMNPPPPAAATALTPPRSNRRSNNTNASASSTAPVETPIASIRRSTARSMSHQQQHLQQQNHGGFISTPKRGDDCSSSQQLQQVVYSPLHEPKIAFDELSDSLHDYRPQLFSPKIPTSTGNANRGRLVMKSAVEEGAAVANAVAEEEKEAAVGLDEEVEVEKQGTDDEIYCRNGDGYNEHVVNDDVDVSLKVQRTHEQQQQNDNGDEDDVEMMDVDEREYEEEEEEEEVYEDDDATAEEEFDPYLFMHHVPPKTDYASLLQHLPKVPPKSKESPYYTLVLDLDETLVHCTVDEKLCKNPDLIFNVDFNGMSYTVYAKKRPFLVSFLQRISKAFEIVVFTASQSVYANALLDKIDPNGELIKHRIFRESCLPVHGNYLKDLTVLGPSRPLCASILVDNSPHAFAYNIDNGIPIESWFDDSNDRELLKLELFLQEHILSRENVVDVRDVIRKEFDMKTKILEHVTFIRALAASRGHHPRNWTS
eukprot:CAMPEP_0116070652 /NCGR_PEP_ID=MMETSP0322-20121206/13195_1 /TAXON_ID=163516 /ORGANISM="Leptocylindrus danicus var. apora, Strain B651" /LENGTH=500 /DNA_ID=CAMNT_0003558617 /DNA_START=42 /DNA_END=1544 /DNA_ORIENTATION=-